jgi:hypothetical protein
MTATTVHTLSGWPELTGTATAELWGWFPDTTAPRIEQLDKTNGSAITTFNLSALAGTPQAWAFAFWGGDFWVFLAQDSDLNSTVYHINGTSGAIVNSKAAPSLIVGAGVSTCAPTVIQ